MENKEIKSSYTKKDNHYSYHIEVAESSTKLCEKVEKALSKGWRLQGGVSVLFEKDKFLYAQAMIL